MCTVYAVYGIEYRKLLESTGGVTAIRKLPRLASGFVLINVRSLSGLPRQTQVY
jgi:hypothetical protein